MGAELLQVDPQTEQRTESMTKLIAASLNFANAPNKGGFVLPNTLQSMVEIIALAEENVLISNLFSWPTEIISLKLQQERANQGL